MKHIKNIGIIGQGFVGNAVKTSFVNHYKIYTYDVLPEKSSCKSISELLSLVDMVFVCLPTPMKSSGECDISLLENTLNEIQASTNKAEFDVIIKSTIPPGTSKFLSSKYNKINIIFNPEFLTEANAVNDYKNQTRIVLGVPNKNCSHIFSVFNKVFPQATIIKTKHSVAEMVKYTTNCFLATKVSFANELHQICEKLDIDYDKVVEYAKYDKRLGNSHWTVPGPDGDFGYGGHCFPKDIAALKYLANEIGVCTPVINGVIEKNDEIRQDRDWESQLGRAVVNDFRGRTGFDR